MVNKNKPWLQIGLIGLVTIISISLVLRFNNEKRHVRKQFNRLSEAVSFAGGEGLIAHGLKSNRLADLFAEETTLSIPVHGLTGQYSRTEIIQNALAAKNMCERLSLDFYDLAINISDQSQAQVTTTARVKGHTFGGEAFNDVRELHCDLRKIKGHWLFTACRVDSIITR